MIEVHAVIDGTGTEDHRALEDRLAQTWAQWGASAEEDSPVRPYDPEMFVPWTA